jgi:UDP-N-acetylmuramoylalanine--D-glutamate ligase
LFSREVGSVPRKSQKMLNGPEERKKLDSPEELKKLRGPEGRKSLGEPEKRERLRSPEEKKRLAEPEKRKMLSASAREPLRGKRVTILGAGTSGVALAMMARRFGASVFVSDAASISVPALETLTASGVDFEQEGHTDRIFGSDVIVVGSGFPPSAPVLARLAGRGAAPVSELDFVMPFMRGRVIGVTGSNGKTTTTALLGRLINACGARCAAAGNIGLPMADAAGKEYDYVVLELSSFQLHWAKSVKLAGAIITNLAPDHIDWHGSYDNYVAAKAKAAAFANGGFQIVQKRDVETIGGAREGMTALSWGRRDEGGLVLSEEDGAAYLMGEKMFDFSEVSMTGAHNMENAAMAMTAVSLLGLDATAARNALKSFEPPPHRCKLFLERGGVRYIDDSKGTNIAASVAAMSSIKGPHIVILGGHGKGEDYSQLARPLAKFARMAVLIGEEAASMASALRENGYLNFREAGGMESAVRMAVMAARPGDSVLLSPACSSFDAYENYKERGDHFVSLVLRITGEGAAE